MHTFQWHKPDFAALREGCNNAIYSFISYIDLVAVSGMFLNFIFIAGYSFAPFTRHTCDSRHSDDGRYAIYVCAGAYSA